GNSGLQRIVWNISTVVRCERLMAVVGWPLPAAAVISRESLHSSMAWAWTAASNDIPAPFVRIPPATPAARGARGAGGARGGQKVSVRSVAAGQDVSFKVDRTR